MMEIKFFTTFLPLTLFLSGGYQIDTCLPFSLYWWHGFCSESEQPNPTFPFLKYHFHIFVQVPGLPENPPNFLVASDLNHHVTPVAVVPDVVEDLVDDSASEMGAASSQLADERERYIDQLLAEIESLQVIKSRVGDVTGYAGLFAAITSLELG